MTNPLSSAFRLLFTHTAPYRRWRHRRLFPGLAVADSANLRIAGRFAYGAGAQIGPHSEITVFDGGTLELGDGVFVGRRVELGTNSLVRIGDHTSIQDGSVILGKIEIGRYCTIAYRLYVSSGRHYFDLYPEWLIKDQDTYAQCSPDLVALHDRAVIVEDDCWIGANVVLMQGILVGKGCVIGANAVVTESLPPYSVAAGAPARVIRKRLDFVPPSRIEARNPQHLPYFYSGFSVSQNALKRTNSLGGIAAADNFALALSSSSPKTVTLIARTVNGVAASLRFNDQTMPLTAEPAEITFSLRQINGPVLRFFVETSLQGPELVAVQSAWLE